MSLHENKTQLKHAMLPVSSSEELSRQEFVKDLKLHLAMKVAPGNRIVYERNAKARFEKESGKPVSTRHDVRKAMEGQPIYRFWSALQRTSQEMMWNSVQIAVLRQHRELIDNAKSKAQAKSRLGTLTLDAKLGIPPYHDAVDIHCQPGGYCLETAEEDVSSGAVYDRAVYLYAMGRMGPANDDMGQTAISYLKKAYPGLKPKRILDMGCTVGHSTLPYVDAYPEAEVYALDVAAPCLRYAHARAESLGKKVHFSQQNAEKTNFPDGYFDLIVSHILMHETSHKASRNIMKEANRLLRPGGVVLHVETPPYKGLEPFDAFMLDWDTRNNNEPYWGSSHEIDSRGIAGETGFDPKKAFEAMVPSAFDAAEKERTKVFQGGDFGGGGMWYVYGAQK